MGVIENVTGYPRRKKGYGPAGQGKGPKYIKSKKAKTPKKKRKTGPGFYEF